MLYTHRTTKIVKFFSCNFPNRHFWIVKRSLSCAKHRAIHDQIPASVKRTKDIPKKFVVKWLLPTKYTRADNTRRALSGSKIVRSRMSAMSHPHAVTQGPM